MTVAIQQIFLKIREAASYNVKNIVVTDAETARYCNTIDSVQFLNR